MTPEVQRPRRDAIGLILFFVVLFALAPYPADLFCAACGVVVSAVAAIAHATRRP